MEDNVFSEFYTFDQVRQMLDLSKSRCADLFNKRTKGSEDFPGFKVGRTWRVRKESFDSWITEQEKKVGKEKEDTEELEL